MQCLQNSMFHEIHVHRIQTDMSTLENVSNCETNIQSDIILNKLQTDIYGQEEQLNILKKPMV